MVRCATLAVALLAMPPADAKNIILVGNDTGPGGFTYDFLDALGGHTITTGVFAAPSPGDVTALNNADLIVFGRSVSSGNYADDNAVWASITTPIIALNPFVTRQSRIEWQNDDNLIGQFLYDDGGVETVTNLGAVLFGSAAGAADFYSSSTGNIDTLIDASSDLGDGRVLATGVDGAGDSQGVAAAFWPAGSTNMSGDVFAGPRYFFATTDGVAGLGLTQAGADALEALINIPEPGAMTLCGLGAIAVVSRRRSR